MQFFNKNLNKLKNKQKGARGNNQEENKIFVSVNINLSDLRFVITKAF